MLASDKPFDLDDLRRIWNTGEYGGPGIMPQLNRSFNDASPVELDEMFNAIRYLCWGEDPDAQRIDRMLSDDDFRISGLGESVIMKLLAITHPETYLPVFPYRGENGKRQMLRVLELDEPEGSRGEIQVASNTLLRERLEQFFPDDALGMAWFLYWYLKRSGGSEDEDVAVNFGYLADELLIDSGFLSDIVAL